MIKVIVEKGAKRVFASAADWPGYARGAKTEALALEALYAYGPRYAKVVKGVVSFVSPKSASDLSIVERTAGSSGTDFGVPSVAARVDASALTATEGERIVAIIEASWAAFDRAARAATGKKLTTGPRGGGRSVEKMTAHVLEADVAYLSKLGSRAPKVEGARRAQAVRRTIVAAFRARVRGEPLPDPSKAEKLWSPRYFARRSAWHALDHAWELEDRSRPAKDQSKPTTTSERWSGPFDSSTRTSSKPMTESR